MSGPAMRRSSLATLLYLLVVFASGALVGGFANRLYMAKSLGAPSGAPRSRAELRKEYIKDMRSRLHLTDPQISQLQQIMDTTGQKMHELHKTIDAEHVRQVTAILNDSQKTEYAKMRDERDKLRQEQAKK